ncbi:MAG: cytoplasmic protein [Alphaproteobacteria bacterium]|nr:cytoplasmic protein [Alphaproteobacteria bacterium]
MSFDEDTLRAAHKHCARHRAEIEKSKICGCFYCRSTFEPSLIEEWLDEGDGTAFCPKCAIDSVLGEASGFPVSDAGFLQAMYDYYFVRTVHVGNQKSSCRRKKFPPPRGEG